MCKKAVALELRFAPMRLNSEVGNLYWIDLSHDDAARLHQVMADYLAVAQGGTTMFRLRHPDMVAHQRPESRRYLRASQYPNFQKIALSSFRKMVAEIRMFHAIAKHVPFCGEHRRSHCDDYLL